MDCFALCYSCTSGQTTSYLRNSLSLNSVLCGTPRVCTPTCLCHLCSIPLRVLVEILRNQRHKCIYNNVQSQFLAICWGFFSQEYASGVLSITVYLSVSRAAYSVMTVWLNTSLPQGEPA